MPKFLQNKFRFLLTSDQNSVFIYSVFEIIKNGTRPGSQKFNKMFHDKLDKKYKRSENGKLSNKLRKNQPTELE